MAGCHSDRVGSHTVRQVAICRSACCQAGSSASNAAWPDRTIKENPQDMHLPERRMRSEPAWLRLVSFLNGSTHQHVERYVFARNFARGRTILDAACGSGYGSVALYGGGASRVDSFDLAFEGLLEMVTAQTVPGLQACGDVTRLPLRDFTYDIYVSFETIEHIPDDQEYLVEVTRVLKPDGIYICSTPNRTITNPSTTIHDRPHFEHHVREYSRSDLETTLSSYFEEVEMWGQRFVSRGYLALLESLGRATPRLAVAANQVKKLIVSSLWNKSPHHPEPFSGREPEINVAVCRRPRDRR